jgi:hypothetical protein
MLFCPLLLLVLWKLKYYYFAVYLPCLLAGGLLLLLYRRSRLRNPWAWVCLFFLLLAGITGIITRLHPNLEWHYFPEVIVQTHDTLYALSKADNRIEYNSLQPTVASFLQNLPLALVSGLFRPFWGECSKPMQWMNGLENLSLLLLAGTSLFRTWQKKDLRLSQEALILSYTAGLYYKVAFLPFMIYLLVNGAGWQKVPSDRDGIRQPPARFSTGGRKF